MASVKCVTDSPSSSLHGELRYIMEHPTRGLTAFADPAGKEIRSMPLQWVPGPNPYYQPIDSLEGVKYRPLKFGQTLPTVAFKADAGKPRWSLLMRGVPKALASVVRVLSFAVRDVADGGKGYVPHSWQQVPNAKERYEDALYRHLNKIALGETHDDESKELHWAHVATNALFLAEFYQGEEDDRDN